MFYNGTARQPERQEYRLSEMFYQEEKEPELELRVTVLNINEGYNQELLERCESLRGYMRFVCKVREKIASGIALGNAVKLAVEECIAENIMAGFFKKHKGEIIRMGIAHLWSVDRA